MFKIFKHHLITFNNSIFHVQTFTVAFICAWLHALPMYAWVGARGSLHTARVSRLVRCTVRLLISLDSHWIHTWTTINFLLMSITYYSSCCICHLYSATYNNIHTYTTIYICVYQSMQIFIYLHRYALMCICTLGRLFSRYSTLCNLKFSWKIIVYLLIKSVSRYTCFSPTRKKKFQKIFKFLFRTKDVFLMFRLEY